MQTLRAWFIVTVFLAELGDKTQLATLLFASEGKVSPLMVFVASAGALVLSSAIAVGLDALPIVAYYSGSGSLAIAQCGDLQCCSIGCGHGGARDGGVARVSNGAGDLALIELSKQCRRQQKETDTARVCGLSHGL